MLKSSLCNCNDAYIFVNETTTIIGEGSNDDAKLMDERNKGVMFKNCAPFIDCICERDNTQIDNTKDLDTFYVIVWFNRIQRQLIKTSRI